ncbi:hypothetical protein DL89DRAFT_269391 [Linderina pennispora]|uniref:Uncharacterized protein n=1 Tax=Linderina pennispora TaxID=61395 RepID=A0A1Y1W370_9FUNG|nr:uncharacterized protein DL89DRAFT_269391 [Linderina pennispora]ORX67604.1 hypothetical protein DL89DRAFT_269391 [Linderina pennispora]
MPPKRKPKQKPTLGQFFDIKPAPRSEPTRKQPSLDKFFGSATPTRSASSDLAAKMDGTILISDSSDDELIDIDSILGTPKPSSQSSSTSPIVEIVSPKRPVQTAVTPKPLYRNSLKSLVRDRSKKKYDLAVLDQPMESSDEGEELEAIGMLELDQDEADRIRAQLGAATGDMYKAVSVSMFAGPNGKALAPVHALDSEDPVDRLCIGARPLAIERLVGSQWLAQRLHMGWRLSPGMGDLLLRLVVNSRSLRTSMAAFGTLAGFLDAHMSQWQLSLAQLQAALEQLQGPPADAVQLCRPQRTSSRAGGNGQRIQHVLGVAARSLDECMPAADTAQALQLVCETMLDHRNQQWLAANQRSLAGLMARVVPRSKWSVVWPDYVQHMARRLQPMPVAMQAALVERMPAGNARSMQVRRTLAFAMLWMAGRPADDLASRIVLPPQLIVRMASELLDDVLGVHAGADFARLAACVALLGNVLDSLDALRDVPEEVALIHAKLAMANRRIADGRADNMDKTRAKDALQTLLVRINLTVVVDTRARRGKPKPGARLDKLWKPR